MSRAQGAQIGKYVRVKIRREEHHEVPSGNSGTDLPEALLAEARTKPGGWVYEIDPRFDPNGAVPPEGIKGAWKVGDDGVPTGDYQPNPNYRPDS
jgi:hypothetical protein